MNNKPTMTRKEALAVVHKVYEAGGVHIYSPDASHEAIVLREQIHVAFQVLDIAVHGKIPLGFGSLCDVCYLHYVPTDNPFVRLKGDSAIYAPCTQCLGRLKTEGKIESLEDWRTGEVTPC